MFEKLFVLPTTIAQHERGPMAEERRRFLAHLAEGGAHPTTLRGTAFYLLGVASRMHLAGERKVCIAEVEAEAKQWAHRHPLWKPHQVGFQGPRMAFRSVAIRWLRFLNRLVVPAREERYADLVTDFARYMEKDQGLSLNTIATRSWYVRKFLARFSRRGWSFDKARLRDTEEALAWQGRQGYTRATLRTYADALRAFFRHAERRGWCRPGIAEAITAPRLFRQERLPRGPSWADVQRLLASVKTNHPSDIRDRAILMLLAIYGFREDEVRCLQLDDLDWEHELILLRRPKQRCTQPYPLTRPVGEAILRYLKEVRPRVHDRSLFITLHAPYKGLCRGSLWQTVGNRLRDLGIVVPHFGPHCLRHACAARLVAQGLSLKEIGDHLGHRSADATQIYAKVDLVGLREVGNFDLGGLL